MAEEMLELCHIRTEIKGHLCLISMPYLSTPSIRLCLLGLMCRVLRLLRNCLCLRKTKGREEEEVVITLFVLFDYVSLLTSSSIFFFFFIVVSFFLEKLSSHVALSLGRSSSIRLSSFRTVYPSGWLYLWPSIRPPLGHCPANLRLHSAVVQPIAATRLLSATDCLANRHYLAIFQQIAAATIWVLSATLWLMAATVWPLFDHYYLFVVLPLLSGFCSAALRPITAGCLCPLTVGPYGQLFLPMRLSVYGIHH